MNPRRRRHQKRERFGRVAGFRWKRDLIAWMKADMRKYWEEAFARFYGVKRFYSDAATLDPCRVVYQIWTVGVSTDTPSGEKPAS